MLFEGSRRRWGNVEGGAFLRSKNVGGFYGTRVSLGTPFCMQES